MHTRTLSIRTFTWVGLVATLFVTAFMLLTPAHHAAAASEEEELRERIQELLEIIQERVEDQGGSCPDVGMRPLRIGSRGMEVLYLQQFLNRFADTRVAQSGPGSRGQETMYYGQSTADAVARFQEKYRSSILTPVGLYRGSGYFGDLTRMHIMRLCAGEPTDEDEDEDEEDVSRDDARDALSDADDAIDELEDAIDAASSGDARDDAEDELEDAQRAYNDAQDAYDDRDYERSVEYAEEAEDIANDALDDLRDAEDEDSYGISDIDSIVREEIDPTPTTCDANGLCKMGASDDEYYEYVITLDDGTVHEFEVSVQSHNREIDGEARDTGYTGSISDFLDMTVERIRS